MPYRSAYAPKIADLILQQGEDRARMAADSGRVWGGAVQNIGQQVAGVLGDVARRKEEAPMRALQLAKIAEEQRAITDAANERAAVGAAVDPATGQIDSKKAAGAVAKINPVAALKWWQQASEDDKAALARDKERAAVVSQGAGAVLGVPPAERAGAYSQWRAETIQSGHATPEQIPEQFNEGWLRYKQREAMTVAQQVEEIQKAADLDLRQKQEQRAITTAQQAQADREADNKRADATAAEVMRHNGVMEKRPVAGASSAGNTDVADSVQGMIDGTIPPILPGRASKDYLALTGEAKRRGYDLAGAATDWVATQKHIATLNGAQQTRLNQSVNALPDMLDSVDALATKWKAGRFPLLNRASLAAAKSGAYGKDAASIANQLAAQIADVTADLGNVYMGGNSPTDHALKLAGKSLQSDWDEKVLHDMVALAKANVKIRQNSIRNTGVAGASAANPYAPTAPPERKPIPGIPGAEAELRDGKWVRVK